jgi:hypothetical protein
MNVFTLRSKNRNSSTDGSKNETARNIAKQGAKDSARCHADGTFGEDILYIRSGFDLAFFTDFSLFLLFRGWSALPGTSPSFVVFVFRSSFKMSLITVSRGTTCDDCAESK